MSSAKGKVSSTLSKGIPLPSDGLEASIPTIASRKTQELVIALVGPVCSGCSKTSEILTNLFEGEYGYEVKKYKPSTYIEEQAKCRPFNEEFTKIENNKEDRISRYQDFGDYLREQIGNNYLAAKAIESIAQWRSTDGIGKTFEEKDVHISKRQIHIIDSLKHPDEVELLRSTYGDIFWLLGIFAPEKIRRERLVKYKKCTIPEAVTIIDNDYAGKADSGQKVRDVFHQADFFLRNDKDTEDDLEEELKRFLDVIFHISVQTPTLQESSMYAAYAEATKSACLSRQVGASIVNKFGKVIGLGRNDVPKYGGDLYGQDDKGEDKRCYRWGNKVCHNDKNKDILYLQIYDQLKKQEVIKDTVKQSEVDKAIKATGVRSLMEFSRSVHAEMDAIISVARLGHRGLVGSTLYSTTFPCHSCARHIVASGIARVYFVEPYPKSLAMGLHNDAISEDVKDFATKVIFLQYTGFSPRNILKLFKSEVDRKDSGKLITRNKKDANPSIKVSLDDYTKHEQFVVQELSENEKKAKTDRQATML